MGVVFSALARGAAESGLTAPESAYIPLRRHPELFGTEMKAEWFEPSFLALVEAARNGSTPARLVADGLLREETAGVYSFAMLRPRFCAMVLEEIEGYQLSGLPIRRPNSMNNYGIIVNHIGMQQAITWLQRMVLQPISDVLFPVQSKGGFDGHHSFMVKYTAGEDLGLDMHTDDSDVTFNMPSSSVARVAPVRPCHSRLPLRRAHRRRWVGPPCITPRRIEPALDEREQAAWRCRDGVLA